MAPYSSTSIRDRTSEFLSIADRLQKLQGSSVGPSGGGDAATGLGANGNATKKNVQQHTEFAKTASQIGLGIHKTSVKLQKLAQLAKRTSMFDDPAAEIEELTGIIKQDIQSLNSSIADLQRISGRTKEDSKQSQEHSHTVVDNLRTRLKDATQEFKDVLTVRTDNLKQHKERRQLFSSAPDASERLPLLSRPQSNLSAQALFGGPQESTSGRPGFMQQQQQQSQQMVPQQDAYMNSRAEALHNVEATIVELGSIFTQLAEMVAAQGEMAQRIDENVEETLHNVDNAKMQLLKYLNSISSSRWLILKVFSVLMVFMVIFVMFIV